MRDTTYKVTGTIFFVAALFSLVFGVIPGLKFEASILADGIWLIFVGTMSIFVLGIIYLLIGFGKLSISKFTDRSVKLSIFSIFLGGIALIIMNFQVWQRNGDPMGLILVIPIILLSYLLSTISLLLLIIPIFKK